LHWRATMNSFRLAIVKNTMIIYVYSFRLCQPLLSGWVAKLCLSRTGFVYVKNLKNSENSSITIMFLSVIYLRFIITLVKLIKRKKRKKMSSMNKSCEKKQQQHIIKIFYMWMFCITVKGRNTKRFVQNWHSPSHLRQNGHDFV
jgi:hypothetical protein